MKTGVFVAGVGMTPFGKYPQRTQEDLGREAVLQALDESGIDRSQIQEAFCGSSYGGPLLGQRILRQLGMTGIPITNVENACSSGGSAIREAVTAIAAERCEIALVVGVEQLSRFGGGTIPLEGSDHEVQQGMTMPALYAMRAQRYMAEHDAQPRDLALVSVKARENASLNPYAQSRRLISVENVLESRMIADPLTLYMCCPTGDGAAAAVLTSRKRSKSDPARIRIDASVLRSGEYTTGARDMARSDLTERTAAAAYTQAGIGPEDVDVAEVHDAFAISELMYCEALGFCSTGLARDLVGSGETKITGRIPVNPSGGLLAKGHPVGATGVAQLCEAVWQLRGQAGPRQVASPRVALTHCTGGGISGLDHGACTVHVVSR